MEKIKPKYPIYIPSKGRYNNCLTAKFLIKDQVDFYLVIEPQEKKYYEKEYKKYLLLLPWNNHKDENGNPDGLIAARNWIKQDSIKRGYKRHWQLDDNSRAIYRYYKGKRIRCNAGVAIRAVEDFVDRYENIAIAGMNYDFFAPPGLPPFYLNNHVYSCSLILNEIPHKWRLRYNDDTDICLQVLADGWCTVLINAFLIKKAHTMTLKGGNTDNLYQGDGRLKMARSLERMWPGVVETKRRFKRPQHVIKNQWGKFDTPLKLRKDIDLKKLPKVDEYGMELKQVKEIKSERLKRLIENP